MRSCSISSESGVSDKPSDNALRPRQTEPDPARQDCCPDVPLHDPAGRDQTKPAGMVRRRSTVRFRNGVPAQRGFSNIGFQDQVTNQVIRLQLTAGAARRIQTPVSLWLRQSDSMRRRQTKPPGIVRRRSGFGRCPSPLPGGERSRKPGRGIAPALGAIPASAGPCGGHGRRLIGKANAVVFR